eukprot:TRINITY_DN9217_c0_g4_i5.p1 TRINITY_DN9217_c0_g4~~TRINITY_DN9217_c0_g4_i5.p1  ORF type:complete len:336 (+),score=72.08 TRINITY_DN9217_c0_g4_i5:140-1147(+)
MSEKRWTKFKQARYFHKLTCNSFTKLENDSLENSIKLLQSSAKNSLEQNSPSNTIKKNTLLVTRSAKLLGLHSDCPENSAHSCPAKKKPSYATANPATEKCPGKLPMQTIKEVVQKMIRARAVKNEALLRTGKQKVGAGCRKGKEKWAEFSNVCEGNNPHEKLLIMKSDKYLLEMIYRRKYHKPKGQSFFNPIQHRNPQKSKRMTESKTVVYSEKGLKLVETHKALPQCFNLNKELCSTTKGKGTESNCFFMSNEKTAIKTLTQKQNASSINPKKGVGLLELTKPREELRYNCDKVNKRNLLPGENYLLICKKELEYGTKINDLLSRLKRFSDKA